MIMIPLIAFVTLMSGVCSEGETFQITCQPTKQAKINTVKCERKDGGALSPTATTPAASATIPTDLINEELGVSASGSGVAIAAGFAGAGGAGGFSGLGAGQVTSPA